MIDKADEEFEKFEKFKNACINGAVENQFRIRVFGYNADGSELNIYNKNIVADSLKIEQAICDDSDLKFGGTIAGSFEIEISNMPDLTGKYISVYVTQTAMMPLYPGDTIYPGATLYPGYVAYTYGFVLFSGEVYSCKYTKNRLTRKLVAYDRFYWKGTIDCTEWYRGLFGAGDKITLGDLRLAILKKFRIIQAENDSCEVLVPLPADDFTVYKLEDKVTVGELLRMICEFNGCFMLFNGNGNVEYITIGSDKFQDNANTEEYTFYIDAEIEDYTKSPFSEMYIPELSGYYNLNTEYGENLYFMEGNTLMTTGYEAQSFSQEYGDTNTRSKIKNNFDIEYIPLNLKAVTRLWVELGDRIKLKIKWYSLETVNGVEKCVEHEDTVYSYVLSRRISGTQVMTDEIIANGENLHYTEDSFGNES